MFSYSYFLIYVLCLFVNRIKSITDDWSFIFERSFQNESIIQGNKYKCKIDIDSDGIIYGYLSEIHIGTSKSSSAGKLRDDCYPGYLSKRCVVFNLHDGDYCRNTHYTAQIHLQCLSDSNERFEGLVGVTKKSACHYTIGIVVECPKNFFVPTLSPTSSPTLPIDETNYTQIANLGTPVQYEQRLLVAVASCWIREPTLLKQLQSYVNICNNGWEVHIIIYTGVKIWEVSELQYLWQSSMLYCDRLNRMLPVVVQYVESCTSLAAKHRINFKELVNNYDLFVSQEDDMAIKLQHIRYYVKWAHILDGTEFYPGFATAEIPTSVTRKHFSVNHKDNPLIWRTFTSNYDQDNKFFQVIKIKESVYLYYVKDWAPAYMITQKLLKEHVHKTYWLEDEFKTYNEYNTHFQHLWLAWHYKFVIPYDDFWFSWIHHTPDRYIGLSYEQRKISENSSHENHNMFHNYYNYLPAVVELDLFLEDCTMLRTNVPRTYDIFHHKNSQNLSKWQQNIKYAKDIKCITCLTNSHFAQVTLSFIGNYSFETKISNIEATVTCEDKFIWQFRTEYRGPQDSSSNHHEGAEHPESSTWDDWKSWLSHYWKHGHTHDMPKTIPGL